MQDQLEGARVARLILAGNSLTMPVRGTDDKQPVREEVAAGAQPCAASRPASLHPCVICANSIVLQDRPADPHRSETIQHLEQDPLPFPPNQNPLARPLRYPLLGIAHQPHPRPIRSGGRDPPAATFTKCDVRGTEGQRAGMYDKPGMARGWRTKVRSSEHHRDRLHPSRLDLNTIWTPSVSG